MAKKSKKDKKKSKKNKKIKTSTALEITPATELVICSSTLGMLLSRPFKSASKS